LKIGILSDTHGWLDDRILHHFKDCDEIWHAGDVGSIDVIDKLKAFKPTIGVYGNIDNHAIKSEFPEFQMIKREGVNIMITHIAGTPKRYNNVVSSKLKEVIPNMLVCGHSHILKVMADKKNYNMLYVNPGAAGKHGIHKMRTIIRLELDRGRIENMEVIELGKRSQLH
jgi:uncharacterized protein